MCRVSVHTRPKIREQQQTSNLTQQNTSKDTACARGFVCGVLLSPRLLAIHETVHGRTALPGGGGIPRLYHEVLLHVVEEASVVVPLAGPGLRTRVRASKLGPCLEYTGLETLTLASSRVVLCGVWMRGFRGRVVQPNVASDKLMVCLLVPTLQTVRVFGTTNERPS